MADKDKFDLESKLVPRRPAIALVAPDPDKADPAPVGHFNTLVVKPEYRIRLRLGNIDNLFPTTWDDRKDLNTKGDFTGRKARLQVVGFFSRPLSDPKMDTATAAETTQSKKAAHEVPWEAFKKAHKTKLDAVAARDREAKAGELLLEELQKYVVEGGKLPPTRGLGYIVKIKMPGGYPFTYPKDKDVAFLSRPRPHLTEKQALTDNTVLGKIPVMALVHKRLPNGQWAIAPNVSVYFQLIKPDAIPAADGAAHKPLRKNAGIVVGPDGFVSRHKDTYKAAAATDPQVDNAHKDFGGKRGGGDVAGTIFDLTEVEGFHKAHTGGRVLKDWKAINKATKALEPIRNAVRVVTNDDGEAGVIFMPGVVGGDRYKLRAFIGPPTIVSDGTEKDAVVVDTGTMVRWKTVHLSRYIQHQTPSLADLDATAKADLNAKPGFRNWNRMGAVSNIDFAGQAKTEYAKAYLDFVIDPSATEMPQKWQDIEDELRKAHADAVAYAKGRQAAMGVPWDLDKLMYFAKNSPFTINLRSPAAYNALAGVTAAQRMVENVAADGTRSLPAATTNPLDALFTMYMGALIKGLGKNGGYLPGLVVFQGPLGDTYTGVYNSSLTTSGIGQGPGCFVWYGATAYATFPYNLTSNTTHEMGHCLVRPHQPYDAAALAASPGASIGGAFANEHNSVERCVMSYMTCPGDYCGHCICSFMGMDTTSATFRGVA